MAIYKETLGEVTLPVVIQRGVVSYPSSNVAFDVMDKYTEAAIRDAISSYGGHIILLSVNINRSAKTSPTGLSKEDFFAVGTVANIVSAVKTSNEKSYKRAICAGLHRAEIVQITPSYSYYLADAIIKDISTDETDSEKSHRIINDLHEVALRISSMLSHSMDELFVVLDKVRDPGAYADIIASSGILTSYEDRKKIIECFEPIKRAELLLSLLNTQIKLMQYGETIHQKTQRRINKAQKDYYLREQMNVIRDELGEESASPVDELMERIEKTDLPDSVREGLTKECRRMSRIPFGAAELTVLENHIETCLDLPWKVSTIDSTDIKAAEKILEADHYGLKKVKERILESLAVRKLNPDINGQIICLVGPPGTGKTSIASSVARALGRNFVRVSLGGIRDEAEIRGHRKTYVGAMPGRIINAIREAGSNNPLILFDEIDKMASDIHGDPCAAMLEVLDGEQNCRFRDHFIEFPFDLSGAFFIATANTLDTIPRPLLDRMEIIELGIYTRTEKLMIAKQHLIPKQLKRHGIPKSALRFSDGAIYSIIDNYTREAGVRGLERKIADVIRKFAREYVERDSNTSGSKRFSVSEKNLEKFLGARKIIPDKLASEDEVGAVTGLAYTQVGGDTLEIEAVVTDGKGKLELTGSLGDVMKESARIAMTCAKVVANQYGYTADFTEKKDVHIHVPDGAVPKDGPSAGITMCTALVSALSGIKVRHDIAMTGELSLRGNVLAIGGLKEKTLAAYRAGIKTIIIPKDNEPMLEDVDELVRNEVTFIPCTDIRDVLNIALIK